jgi:hypothetical protein
MKDESRMLHLTPYPDWHQKPLRLNVAEIQDPHSVVALFFDRYSLPQIRECLKELLHDSLCADGVDAPSQVMTHGDIERLVEAAWLIREQEGGRVAKKENTSRRIHERVTDEKEDLLYPVIYDFFDSFTLPFARKYLASAVKAAESKHVWKKAAPTDLLFFFESLETLVNEVFKIVKHNSKTKKGILSDSSGTPDLLHFHLYCGNYDQHQPWDYFPRSLSTKEYNDPYLALQKFTNWADKKEWKQILQYILSYALGANSLSDLSIDLELVKVSELLQKMMDACHLISVRTAKIQDSKTNL